MQAIGYTHGSISTLLNGVGQSLVFGDIFQNTIISGFDYSQTAPYEFTIGPGTAYIGLGRVTTGTDTFNIPSGGNYTTYVDLDYSGNWSITSITSSPTAEIPAVANNTIRVYIVVSYSNNPTLQTSFVGPTGINLNSNVNLYQNTAASTINLTDTFTGIPSGSQTIFNMISNGTPFSIQYTWMNIVCTCSTAPTANVVLTGYFNSTFLGNPIEVFAVNIPAGQTIGSPQFINVTNPVLPAGGNITVVMQSTPDYALSDLTISIPGTINPVFSFTIPAPILKYSIGQYSAASTTIPPSTNPGDLIVVINAGSLGTMLADYNTTVSYTKDQSGSAPTGVALQWKIATASDIGTSVQTAGGDDDEGPFCAIMIFEQGSFNPINPVCNFSTSDTSMIPFNTYNYNTMIFMYGGDDQSDSMRLFEPSSYTTIIANPANNGTNYTLQYYVQQNPGLIPTYTNEDTSTGYSFLVFGIR